MTFSWGAWRSPSAFKKSDFYFLNYLSYYICKGAVQLPPYDTTAPLHRQQEPPRTATHSKTQKQDMQKTYAKNKERNFPAAAMILFSYLLRAVVHLPRGGATRNILLYLLYIALQAHSLRGIFLCKPKLAEPIPAGHQAVKPAVNPGRPSRGSRVSRILKMRHEYDIKKGHKNVTKTPSKKFSLFKLFCILNMRIKKP